MPTSCRVNVGSAQVWVNGLTNLICIFKRLSNQDNANRRVLASNSMKMGAIGLHTREPVFPVDNKQQNFECCDAAHSAQVVRYASHSLHHAVGHNILCYIDFEITTKFLNKT